jgi:hypothetical protein
MIKITNWGMQGYFIICANSQVNSIAIASEPIDLTALLFRRLHTVEQLA